MGAPSFELGSSLAPIPPNLHLFCTSRSARRWKTPSGPERKRPGRERQRCDRLMHGCDRRPLADERPKPPRGPKPLRRDRKPLRSDRKRRWIETMRRSRRTYADLVSARDVQPPRDSRSPGFPAFRASGRAPRRSCLYLPMTGRDGRHPGHDLPMSGRVPPSSGRGGERTDPVLPLLGRTARGWIDAPDLLLHRASSVHDGTLSMNAPC